MVTWTLVALQGKGHEGQKQGGQHGVLKRRAPIAGVHTAGITVGQFRVVVLDLQLLANPLHGGDPGAATICGHCAVHWGK